jgi:hypothetical protein
MKQKELLEKIEEEFKDYGCQIRLIKKIFSYINGKIIRKVGGKMKFYYLNIILFIIFINIAHASSDNLTITNLFSTGEIVSASKINENFDAIETKVNELNLGKSIYYPDGFWGTPILSNTSTYTVPTGKTLYVTAYNATGDYLNFDGISCHGNKWGKHASNLNHPVIVKEGETLTQLTLLNGFLVDKGVEVTKIILDNSGRSFTVPNGKYLIITLFYSINPKMLLVDNVLLSDSELKDEASQERLPYLIPSGKTIKSEDNGEDMCIIGYYMSN